MIESSQSCSTNLRVLVGSIRYFFLGLTVESSVMGPGVAEKIPRRCVAYRRYILAGSRPGRRGTLVSAKVPKASCACASARKSQRVPCAPHRLRGPGQAHFLCLARTRGIPSAPGPAQLRFLRFTVLHRSKDRGSPSVANPLAGAAIHWIATYYPARPSALGSAKGARKIPTRKTAFRLHSGLGLTKGRRT